jgi:DNA gyrase subunit A
MVQRTGVRGISKMGRATQGVKVMNVRGDDTVSAVAVVVESESEFAAGVAENGDAPNGEAPNGDGTSPTAEAHPEDGSEDGSPNGSAG